MLSFTTLGHQILGTYACGITYIIEHTFFFSTREMQFPETPVKYVTGTWI